MFVAYQHAHSPLYLVDNEAPLMGVLSRILGDSSMLDSRADPTVPLVFAVSSKMSSTPTHVSLFR